MSATRKPEMSRAQKAIERVHHKIMDMRDATPMRDGSIEAEEKYLEAYKKAYRESQSSTYFAAAQRYRLFLQGIQSGAPLQPGATQPEHDGVAHKQERLKVAIREEFMRELIAKGWLSGTAVEVRLERMARLVVREHRPVIVHDSWDDPSVACSCGWNLDAHQLDTSWPLHLTEAQLAQLREAVERP